MSASNETYNLSVFCIKNIRLDSFLADIFKHYSRSTISTWIKSGEVLLNAKKIIKPNTKVNFQDTITITIKESYHNQEWEKQDIKLDIIFEDDHIMVINKPAFLTVHPGAGQANSTLANALYFYNEQLSLLPRMGIVHRLDKDTSGIMVVAKTTLAQTSLVAQLQDRSVSRTYHAIVIGNIIAGGTIETDIGRDPKRRTAMAVVYEGKHAITHYRVLNKFDNFTLVEAKLETGRTHQIRVHMAHIKHPLVGDQTYGKRTISAKTPEQLKAFLLNFKRQALHAKHLKFIHPFSGEEVEFECPYPNDFKELLNLMPREQDL